MSMSEIHVHDRLDDFIDGALSDGEMDAVRRHLEVCPVCVAEADGLCELRSAARALPREITPPRDLWAGIAARIEAERATVEAPQEVIEVDFQRSAATNRWRRWAGMAAAAVVLVTVSSGITAYLMRTRSETGAAVATLPAAEVRTGNTALAGFRPAEAEYLSTVASLERELAGRREQLAPETVATVEANLRIIDRAIAEARAALVADPANGDLPHHLSEIYRQKVQLLQSAVQLPVATT